MYTLHNKRRFFFDIIHDVLQKIKLASNSASVKIADVNVTPLQRHG